MREQEKTLNELRAAVQSLTEENTLLRDFAYNVDPSARIVHAHMYSKAKMPPPAAGQSRSLSARDGKSRFS